MNQQRRVIAALAGLLTVSLVLMTAFGLVPGASNSGAEKSADCDSQYNRTVAGQMESSQITEDCRPLPESVENQVLARALSG